MREIRTEIEIDAPPEAVWNVLTDLSSYPEWNPHLPEANGGLRVGESLDVRFHREGASDRTLTVTVTELEPGRRLEWVGRLLSPILFEGRHAFVLDPIDDGRTRFRNHEDLTGVLVRFLVTDDPERDYEAMNEALKTRVERTVSPTA